MTKKSRTKTDIVNTNAVVVNNNIKAQDELKILSKLSKMGLLKSNKKRAPRQAPQMIPQAPEIGRTAPIAFDRTQQAGIDRATLEEAIRRSSVPSNTNDLENDVRFTNQGSQDIPKYSRAANVDLAPEAETTFPVDEEIDEDYINELINIVPESIKDRTYRLIKNTLKAFPDITKAELYGAIQNAMSMFNKEV
jgi:hypothetical protein